MQQFKFPFSYFTSLVLPETWQRDFRLFPASPAQTEELVSCAMSFGEKLVAAALQLPVALEQPSIHPPQVFHH